MKTYTIATVMLLGLAGGCGSSHRAEERKPEFGAAEGAISGKLVTTNSDPFDVSLAGGDQSLKIELISPSSGIAAVNFPRKDKPEFIFSHLKPGKYEVSIFAVINGKRTIAGSSPVTVNPEQITPVTVMLTVTPMENSGR